MERLTHELLWLCCAIKRCCSVRTVVPTGADIWRIATTLQVPPESFLRPVVAEKASAGGVLLGLEHQPIHAALARRVVKGRSAACVFLMPLKNQVARCGLDELRPLPCQSFPAVGSAQLVRVGDEQPCTCRTWTFADLDRPQIGALLNQEQNERQQYHDIISTWNTLVRERAASTGFTFADFCHYLLDEYTQLAPEVRGAV